VFAEYGGIDKTLHLLSILDPIDDTDRRELNKQLTVQESRHCLARKICHGRNQMRQAYREGQEDPDPRPSRNRDVFRPHSINGACQYRWPVG
jgi:TnpA family transposase